MDAQQRNQLDREPCRSFYTELVSMFLCHVVLPLDGDVRVLLEQLEQDPLLTREEKTTIRSALESIERPAPSKPDMNGHGAHSPRSPRLNGSSERNGHSQALERERTSRWPQKPLRHQQQHQANGGAATPGSQLQITERFAISSIPSRLFDLVAGDTSSNSASSSSTGSAVTRSSFGGRLQRIFGRNVAYYIVATGFAVLALLWFWLARQRRGNPGRGDRNQLIIALRNFLASWLRPAARKR